MTDRIGKVITELSSAADLLIFHEAARTKAEDRMGKSREAFRNLSPDRTPDDVSQYSTESYNAEQAVDAVEDKFRADFNPANCGHLAELIRELRDAYLEEGMIYTIRDGTGNVIHDVEEYDEKTGSVTRYLHDPTTNERIKNEMGRYVTYRSKRPKPLQVIGSTREVAK